MEEALYQRANRIHEYIEYLNTLRESFEQNLEKGKDVCVMVTFNNGARCEMDMAYTKAKEIFCKYLDDQLYRSKAIFEKL